MEDIPKTGKETEVGKEQTTLRLPAKLKGELQLEAAKRGVSLNDYILILIDKGRQYLHQ